MTTTSQATPTPFDVTESAQILDDFRSAGFRHIPNVLSVAEVTALKAGIDRIFEDDQLAQNRYNDLVAVRLFETDRIFEEMLTREPIISLVEGILGDDCHLIAQNAIRNVPGVAIDTFHADDLVIAPLPPEIPRHDPRVTLPVFILTVQIPLTDILTVEYGPTEYVPGSHYSGRQPDSTSAPTFEGQQAIPLLCKAGDIYLHNGQCWHRGAPNLSDQTRYLFQLSFGMRWVSQRFNPFINYQMPQHVLDNADERRKRVLGVHPKGAYG